MTAPDTTKALAVGYCRISRADDKSASIEVQEKIIRDWCYRNDVELRGIHKDEGVSGSVEYAKRKGGSAALLQVSKLAKRKGQDVLLVTAKLDRLSRSLLDILNTVQALPKGAHYCGIDVQLDTRNPMSKHMLAIMGVGAEMELDTIRERNRIRAYNQIASGKVRSRIAPYGYVNGPNGYVVEEPREQANLAIIEELLAQDYNYGEVADFLNNERRFRRGGKRWDCRNTRRIWLRYKRNRAITEEAA